MFELNPEQREELGRAEPARAVDPSTNLTYVLVLAEEYERMQQRLHDLDVREGYPLMDEVATREGWSDPEMDSYDVYARKHP